MTPELQLWHALKESNVSMMTGILFVAVYNGWRVTRMERQLQKVVEHVNGCPNVKRSRLALPLSLLIAFAAAVLLSGCAVVTQSLQTTETALDGSQTSRTTRARAWTLFDGSAAVRGLRTSNGGKTQSVGLESVDSQSTTTNAVPTLKALADVLSAIPR